MVELGFWRSLIGFLAFNAIWVLWGVNAPWYWWGALALIVTVTFRPRRRVCARCGEPMTPMQAEHPYETSDICWACVDDASLEFEVRQLRG